MDYINFGIGTGATLALFGWLFRDLGPRIRDRAPREDQVLSARELVSRMAWRRFCRSCGMALTLGGFILLASTLAIAIWNPADETGFRALLVVYATVAILMLVWTGLFLRQFGASGIIRPREASPVSTPVVSDSPATSGQAATASEAAKPSTQSFEEVASARGGLGRFAAFFRRDPAPESGKPADGGDATSVGETSSPASPTDAVIAELSGAKQDETGDKRLGLDDALVTSALGDISPDRMVNDPLHAPGCEDDSDSDPTSVEEPAKTEATQEVEAPTAEDQALETLRKRRLARLSGRSS